MKLMVLILAILMFVTSLGVIFSTHQGRKLFVELNLLQGIRDDLNIEWGKLQLEQSAWATHGRIEQKARQRLQMKLPQRSEVVLITP